MDGTGDHHPKLKKPVPQRQVLNIFSYLWKLGVGEPKKERP
jgi:hypothetical protein